MSKTTFVSYQDQWFWAYDVSLDILLKFVIEVGEAYQGLSGDNWLVKTLNKLRVIIRVNDYGLDVDGICPPEEIGHFVKILNEAMDLISRTESLSENEIRSWEILPDCHISTRGQEIVRTKPIIELGQAIVDMINHSLPDAPTGTRWLHGAPGGIITVKMQELT